MARAIARAILGPKKSRPPLKVKILARGHLKGAQKVEAPFKSQDFHCPPLQMGQVLGFPHKNNYFQQHLNNRCICNFMYCFRSFRSYLTVPRPPPTPALPLVSYLTVHRPPPTPAPPLVGYLTVPRPPPIPSPPSS
jgi:hypothetical protein